MNAELRPGHRIVLVGDIWRMRRDAPVNELIPRGTGGRVIRTGVMGRYVQFELDDEPGIHRLGTVEDVRKEAQR